MYILLGSLLREITCQRDLNELNCCLVTDWISDDAVKQNQEGNAHICEWSQRGNDGNQALTENTVILKI